MNVATINKKIEEYTAKLNKKVPKMKKGKLKLTGIPSHLRKYYMDEIEKLKRERVNLLNLKEYHLIATWDKVRFENAQIRLKINEHFSEPFQVLDSRTSYEFLKPLILRSNLNPLSVSIYGNKINSITNLTELKTVIQILSIQEAINDYFNDFESTSIENILAKFDGLSNQHLNDFFKLSQRSSYFKLLCEFQNIDYKIIPTTELLFSNEKLISEEETFLFTLNGTNGVYIIWESTLINKASYVFKTNKITYITDVQRLFDFIASNQSSKRRKLRFSNKTTENPFNCIGVIEHKNIDTWNANLKSITQ